MPILDIVVPQLGEGLQEVLIHKLLKKPGDLVQRDEPIYIMETDKADVEVESPFAGTLKEWLVEEGKIVSVGALIARIEGSATAMLKSLESASITAVPVEIAPSDIASGSSLITDPVSSPRRTVVFVPPRTRAYCRKLEISDDEVNRIPAATGTLMPADVDRYLAAKAEPSTEREESPKEITATDFKDYPLLDRQRVFNFRLRRSAQLAVPGTMIRELDWQRLEAAVKAQSRQNPALHSSDFETFAYALVQATRDHPEFRSVLVGDDVVRQFEYLNLGIAVNRPGGELLMAVVPKADRLDFTSFVGTIQLRVRQALEGEDQINEQVPLHLNYVSSLEITHGNPVLVAPAIAVVFLGAPTGRPHERKANLGVTFDHRLINGVTAANLLATIVRRIDSFASEDAGSRNRKSPWDPATLLALRESEPRKRRTILEKQITDQVARMTEAAPSDVDPRLPLRMLGFSSLMAVELTNYLATNLGQSLSDTLLWTYPTIAELAAYLADESAGTTLNIEEPPRRMHNVGQHGSTILDHLENLSDEEAEALLKKKVEGKP
jgi:pyruvate/2-oxoglutarate dehydrogenase complex dihydrolipoamide acyltransferase (E2) component/acyl carrier protein